LIENIGLVAIAKTFKDANIAADIYEHTMDTITKAMTVSLGVFLKICRWARTNLFLKKNDLIWSIGV
jgi:hypothetical protein